MKRYEKILEKAIENGGIYETRKYIYKVYSKLHTVLLQYDKSTGKYYCPLTILFTGKEETE